MTPIALITGASQGIGRATVDEFAANGWEVHAVDKQIDATFPDSVVSHQADVSQAEEVNALIDEMSKKVDRLDALVNNAAIQLNKSLLDTTPEEWDAVMASNLRSIFLLSQGVHRLLEKATGAIINVSSVHAFATSNHIAAYAASKGAVMALTRALALEFAEDHIRVNAMIPGAVDTAMLREGLSRGHLSAGSEDERLHELARKIPFGRVADPAEIARGILFLADSDKSGYMTGQSLIMDGGVLARLSSE